MVAGASYDGREEGITKGHKETLGVMDIVIVLIVVIVLGCIHLSKFIKLYILNYVLITVCQLHLNKTVNV